VLRLPADTAVFFFPEARAEFSSLRRTGETCNEEIALIKANCYLRMTPRQELLLTYNRHSATE
jgi:hypothetical protein